MRHKSHNEILQQDKNVHVISLYLYLLQTFHFNKVLHDFTQQYFVFTLYTSNKIFELQTNIIPEKYQLKLTSNSHNTLNFGCGTSITLFGLVLIATDIGDGDDFNSVDPNMSLILTPRFGDSRTSLNKEL